LKEQQIKLRGIDMSIGSPNPERSAAFRGTHYSRRNDPCLE